MRPQPPEYNVDGEAVYIEPNDEAWTCDFDEFRSFNGDGIPQYSNKHPVGRYYNGRTRHRLTPDVEEHLDMQKDPEQFILREVSWRRLAEYKQAMAAGRHYEACADLCREGISNARPEAARSRYGLEFRPNRGGLTDAAVSMLMRIDPGLMVSIAKAINRVNEALDEVESKQ